MAKTNRPPLPEGKYQPVILEEPKEQSRPLRGFDSEEEKALHQFLTGQQEGSYYSRPEFYADGQQYRNTIRDREQVAQESTRRANWAARLYRDAEEAMRFSLFQLNLAGLSGNGNTENARAVLDRSTSRFLEREASYKQYDQEATTAYNDYTRAVDSYNSYIADQQRQFEAWRGTIRDPETVRAELAGVEEQVRKLRAEDTLINLGNQFTNALLRTDLPFGAVPAHQQQENPELAALLTRQALLNEELEWGQYYRYEDLKDASDYIQNGRYKSTSNGREAVFNPLSGTYSETGYDDPVYEYINRKDDGKYKHMLAELSSGASFLGMDKSFVEEMKPQEITTFNYIYATQGKEKAYEYLTYLTGDLNRRQRTEREEEWRKFAREHPGGASILSVAESPLKGLSYLGQTADYLADGEIDQNAGYNKFSHSGSAIRDEVSKVVEEKWGAKGSFAYQTGMSIADNLMRSALLGGSKTLGLAIMSSGAMADSVISAKDRGLNDDQAMVLGTIQGLAEGGIEMLNIDSIFDPGALKDSMVKYIVKNAGAEGAEEMLTELVNGVFDLVIAKDQFQWNDSVNAYLAQGLSGQEAVLKTLGDSVWQMLLSGLGGAISGGIMSGGTALIGSRQTGKIARDLDLKNADAETINALIESGLESPEGSESRVLAERMQEKLARGEQPTGEELSRLLHANEMAIAQEQEGAENHGEEIAGAGVSDGVQVGNAGTGTGEPTGGLAEGAGSRSDGKAAERARAAADIQNRAADLQRRVKDLRRQGLSQAVSSKELGLDRGTDDRSMTLIPKEQYDPDMAQLSQRIYNETGFEVTFVSGRIPVARTDGGVSFVRGVAMEDRIIVQADNYGVSAEQLADHEAYHAKNAFSRDAINREVKQAILENFTEEEFLKVLEQYVKELRCVYDLDRADSPEAEARVMAMIEEEVFADAYAGINAYGAGADRLSGAVNRKMDALYMGKQKAQDNGTQQPTGPPSGMKDSDKGTHFSVDDGVQGNSEGKYPMSVEAVVADIEKLLTEEFYESDDAWGVRVDNYDYAVGEEVFPSHQLFQDPEYDDDGELIYPEGEGFYEGFYDAGELEGVSTVGINTGSLSGLHQEVMRSVRNAENYAWHQENYLYLISGPYAEGGNDLGESIIHDAVVRKKYRMTNDGNYVKAGYTEDRFSMDDSIHKNPEEADRQYLDAVARGDMESVQRMVEAAAGKDMPDSKIRMPDGRMRTVYHGTNTGDFTVFNPDYIGMSSGDDGFFGMGFYFAYSKGEASYYGAKRIIPAYLDLQNPFDFEKELQTYNGKRARSGKAPDAVALMNFADKFPEIAKDIGIGVVLKGEEYVEEISLAEFATAFREVIENKEFAYQEDFNEYGEPETLVLADPQTIEFEYGGQKHSFREYGFQKRWYGKPEDLDVAYEYLANSVYEYVDMIPRTRLILDHNRAFTATLKQMGYDGVIQSVDGDEAVAFDPSQIKSAEPVTYDDNGDPIPLSQRFKKDSPDIRYSFAGEKARTADLDALNTAKQMLSEGVAAETVRQQTGWFKGMDGKWRWEIDDSGAEYRYDGDARFAEIHPEYARHEELMELLLAGDITPGEEQELRQLHEVWGSERKRLRERTDRGSATLQNVLHHDALFEAYPELRGVKVVYTDLPGNTRGRFDPNRNTIYLHERIRKAGRETLLHEIQHAIQDAEGFAGGASISFWEKIQTGENPIHRHDADLKKARARIHEIIAGLPDDVAQDFWRYIGLDARGEEAADERFVMEEQLLEGPYEEEFNEVFMLLWDMDIWRDGNDLLGAHELYRNTAGEIEARDTAERWYMDGKTRRQVKPNLGNHNTVLVEEWLDSLDAEYGHQMQSFFDGDIPAEEVHSGIQSVAAMDSVVSISGNEFAKGEKYLITQVAEFFDSRNNTAWNQQLGEVIMDRKGAKSDLAHGMGRKKAAAFAAVPAVIEQGRVVDYQKNWKGRGYDTAVVAAPVTIGDQEHLAGVVLIRSNQTNRFYVHEVMTTESGASPFKTGARKGDPSGDAPSVFSILNRIMDVKSGGAEERYSVDDGTEPRPEDFSRLAAEMTGVKWDAANKLLEERIGKENIPRFRQYMRDQEQDQKDAAREQAKKRAKEKKQIRQQAAARIERQMEQSQQKKLEELKPTQAKNNLVRTLLDAFSIPDGKKAELRAMISNYADRLLKNGRLEESDYRSLFDRLYGAGAMVWPADEYFADARNYLKGNKIYVSDSIVKDFGDDWNQIRKRAFAAGLYLTRDSQSTAGGVDVWNMELASTLPGLFDAEETDARTILERIIQVAEEGRDEHLSLAEYTARLAGVEQVSEDALLDNLERQMDWALRTFTSSAGIEMQVKEQTVKDRAKASEMRLKETQRRAAEREARKESARLAQERKEIRELQQKTLKALQWLSKNRNKAPEELRQVWDETLGDIDLIAVGAANEMKWSQKYGATWQDLAQMYKDARTSDPNFLPSKELENIVGRLDKTKIESMDPDALRNLYQAAVGLRTEFYNRNNVINDEMQRLFAEVYADSKEEIQSAFGGFSGRKMDKFLNLDQLTPMNVLQRMGGWDPNGVFYSMARQLEHGERDMRSYSVRANRYLEQFLREHEDWVKKADGQGKDAIWYEVKVPELLELHMGDKPIFGETVTVWMTPAQKVHLYLESKNADNLRHMTGGRTFADKELYSQGKRQEALAQGRTIRLAPETVKALVQDLTPEEQELAKLLEEYYNRFATEEINRVSNVLYGYDKAMGKDYAPIYTNQNYTKSEFGVFDATAEGVGNLKERVRSKNPSYNISAFDAFERHVERTARFVGMAIPARNWNTLMNWKDGDSSFADIIDHKWGNESQKYIVNLINNLQSGGSMETETVGELGSKLQSNYISAVFGFNPSIVLKQLGSIPMASTYLGAENLPSPAQLRSIDREFIAKYTRDLHWRTMGYATPETKFLKENPNWAQSNKVFRFLFGGDAITAMDGWAASVLWPWAENKVRREHPELEFGSQADIDSGNSPFWKKVAEEFEDAVSRSQSVSDEIHQGTLRKSKNLFTRTFTLFRSDTAQTYNALRQKIGEARYYARSGADADTQRKARKAVGSVVLAMLLNAVWAEGISLLMAAWKNKAKYYRDEEEELTPESVISEMVSNMVGSMAGLVTGGDTLAEVIGNVLTGEKFYDLEAGGLEQLNKMFTAVVDAAKGLGGFVSDARDIVANDGDLGEYFSQNSGTLLGHIKDVAKVFAQQIGGIPVNNVEAYLIGALKWISPELGNAYDAIWADIGKKDLAGLEGEMLADRIGAILKERKVEVDEQTSIVLGGLYEAGFNTAVPPDVPSSVSVDGESRELAVHQQQAYGNIWSSVINGALDELAGSEIFRNADPEEQVKLLKRLYDYAAEQAKAVVFEDYVPDASVEKVGTLTAAGLSIADSIGWLWSISDMKQGEKFEALRQWGITDQQKRVILGTLIGTDLETESGKPSQYAKFMDAVQEGLSVDQYLDMRLDGLDVEDYLDATAGGIDSDDAYALAQEMGAGALDDLAKWRASVDFSNDVEDQLTALSMVMTDSQMRSVEIANAFGVTPEIYIGYCEIRGQYDSDGSGGYTQAEVQAAIDSMGGLSNNQRAVLWQIMCSSTKSSKNNPYSVSVGQQVLDAKAAVKELESEEEADSFFDELMRQMMGRG